MVLLQIVDLSENTLTIPNHFFVTGEEVVYAPSTGIGTHAIGIARTAFVGVGSTTITIICICYQAN